MTRVIVHAGFYKTGTTSLQAFLHQNRDALAPYAAIYQHEQLGRVTSLGRIYGKLPTLWRRRAFADAFREFLSGIEDAPCILISRESFSGMMIGYRRMGRPVTSYARTAIPLAREIQSALQNRFGERANIRFVYTVRNRNDVIRSSYAHVVRTSGLTDSLDDFSNRFSRLFDLEAEANRIAAALAPTPVDTIRLDDYMQHRFGPAAPLMDMLGVPDDVRNRLIPAPHKNISHPVEMHEALLELNRSITDNVELKRRKKELLDHGL